MLGGPPAIVRGVKQIFPHRWSLIQYVGIGVELQPDFSLVVIYLRVVGFYADIFKSR